MRIGDGEAEEFERSRRALFKLLSGWLVPWVVGWVSLGLLVLQEWGFSRSDKAVTLL